MAINKKRHRTINPEVTDQDGNNAYCRYDQRAPQQCAILGLLHRHSTGTSNWLMSLNVSYRLVISSIVSLRNRSRLKASTQKLASTLPKIIALKQRVEISSRRLDPEIHCVRDHEARPFHLVEHMRLHRGCDVGQQNELGFAIRFREYRLEIFEDVERDRACLTRVQVP